MKKWFPRLACLAAIAALLDLGVMGIKIFTHQYDILFEAYLLLGCFLALQCYVFHRVFTSKCPHCGRLRLTNGPYCPHCGKKIES